jgi:hypothetical protein
MDDDTSLENDSKLVSCFLAPAFTPGRRSACTRKSVVGLYSTSSDGHAGCAGHVVMAIHQYVDH